MSTNYDLRHLQPAELVEALKHLVARDQALTAALLAHIAEVDARSLYLEHACASMFTYCVERLHFAEPTAYKRTEAARIARRFPVIFEMVAAGQLHLSAILLLGPRLTAENHLELLAAAAQRSKREIQRMLAARFPAPDVPTTLRKLPLRPGGSPADPPAAPAESPAAVPSPTAAATPAARPMTPAPAAEAPAQPAAASPLSAPTTSSASAPPALFALSLPPPPRPEIKPLSEDRYSLKVTLSRSVHDKLLDAQALLRHAIPSGDLDQVLGRALDSLLRDLRRQKFGETSKPRAPSSPPPEQPSGSRRFPNADRRQIVARDGLQCSFVDAEGNRCQERAFLELDHIDPVGKGGASEATNGRLLCHRHNMHQAAKAYGADWMSQRVAEARESSARSS